MTFETRIKNLELRLTMALEHVAQAEADLNTIRAKAGLPPSNSLEKPPTGDEGWWGSPGRKAWLDHQEAKGARSRALCAATAAAQPVNPLSLLTPAQLIAAVHVVRDEAQQDRANRFAAIQAIAEIHQREREAAATPPIDAKATASQRPQQSLAAR
jgi:hypothetical protein